MNTTRCGHVREGGTRCASTIGIDEDGFCLHHATDPDRREQVRAIRSLGHEAGHASRTAAKRAAATSTVQPDELPGPLETPADCVTWASWIARAVGTGQVDSRTGDVMLRAVRELRASYDRASMAEELARLRRQVDELKAAGR